MPLTAQNRIAEIQGRQGNVRIVRKGRRNSRVVPVDLATGQDTGPSAIIANDRLTNIRFHDELQALPADPGTQQPATAPETAHTIRVPGRLYLRLQNLARPFETPADVIERHLPPEAGN
jgi:hypothetical protein